MEKSEYWCYMTDFEETYCITALEMQYAGVIPLVTKVAALNETVPYDIKIDNDENRWDNLLERLSVLNGITKKKISMRNRKWAKQQSWHMRSLQWKDFFNDINKK